MKHKSTSVLRYLLPLCLTFYVIYSLTSNYAIVRGALFFDSDKYKATIGTVLVAEHRYKTGYKGNQLDNYQVIYTYSVGNQTYSSEVVDFSYDGSQWKQKIEKYKAGTEVKVFYDPSAPQYSVLEPDNKSFRVFLAPLISLILALVLWVKLG